MKRLSSSLALLVILILANSCHFYKVGKVKDVNSNYVSENTVEKPDYVVLHKGQDYWHLSDIKINSETISGTLEKLDPMRESSYITRLTKPEKSTLRYKRRLMGDSRPTNEVHLYLNENIETSATEVSFPISSILKMEIYDEAVGATVAGYVLPTAAITFTAMVIYVAIVCACPNVYSSDGSDYYFEGGVFTGSIYPSLERTDYLVLSELAADNGNFKIQISNEKMETEYLNYFALEQIAHPDNVEVGRDKYGKLFSYSNPISPSLVVSSSASDPKTLMESDQEYFQFDGPLDNNKLVHTDLSFNKPHDSNSASLVLRGRNTKWFDHTLTKFVELFGDYYSSFSKKQSKLEAEEHLRWMKEQGVSLNVYLKKNGNWEYYDYFHVMGSIADKTRIMNIDLSDVAGDQVEIRLESGFQFWEIDFAGMDFSPNPELKSQIIPLTSALDQGGIDYTGSLASIDEQYVSDFKNGDSIDLLFKTTSESSQSNTYILHARGYYRNDISFSGKPDYSYLKSFRKAGRLSEFSDMNFRGFSESLSPLHP